MPTTTTSTTVLPAARAATRASPSVAVVVVNWNQVELTCQCLDSLSRQSYDNAAIVLVDNGSSDGSADTIAERYPHVRLIRSAVNVGYSAGNNLGIDLALQDRAEYILLLNNDTEVDPDMLRRLVDVLESRASIGIAGPTMYYASPSTRIWSAENHIDWRAGAIRRSGVPPCAESDPPIDDCVVEVDVVDTCAALVRCSVFETVGPMCVDYFLNYDDLDLSTRAKRAGFGVAYVPRAVMWHKVSASMGIASPATTYYMTRNGLLFFWRHARGLDRWIATSAILARTVRTIGAWTLRRRYRHPDFRRRRDANVMAIRDFLRGRFGRMPDDVAAVCYAR